MTRIFAQSKDSTSQSPKNRWEPARVFFDERKIRRADLGGAGDWSGWNNEFDEASIQTNHLALHELIILCF